MLSINQSNSTSSLIDKLNQQREAQTEKLSSAKKINKAADDAAGLQIANRLTSQINQQQQLSFNAQDQANINNVQGAALTAINDGLLRAQELSIQSGNPLYDSSVIQSELDQISTHINSIAAEYLDQNNYISGLDASDPASTQTIIQETSSVALDRASSLGAESNALASQVSTYQTSMSNVSASRSRIEDTDFAQATSEQEKNATLLQSTLIMKKNEEERKGLLFNKLI